MKHVLLLSFFTMSLLTVNSNPGKTIINADYPSGAGGSLTGITGSQPEPEAEKMPAVTFRAQDVCRAELKDFPFDIQYRIVSATVYFSGTNFRGVETGYITSASLKPLKHLMAKCAPGTMVIFDNVKVEGPDKLIRSIQGTSYLLR